MEYRSLLLMISQAIALGAGAGIMAAVYRCILAYEPILNFWFRFGNRFEKKWFFAPIWGCQKCIGGQIALWSTLVLRILPLAVTHWRQIWPIWTWNAVTVAKVAGVLFGLILTICTAIAVADFLCKAINYEKK